MKNFLKVFCGMLLLFLFITPLLYAGNGKIAGVVKDMAGKPIPGVTVQLEGTKMGAAADIEGRYFILNVPPGKYNVSITAVGYKKKIVNNVAVSSDLTAELNATLEEAAVTVDAVTVEAERKLVDKTLTSTRSTITSDELANTLPVATTFEVLQSTPAFYKGFVRGGRQNQTKTVIEGVDVSDAYYAVAADQSLTPFQGYNRVTRHRESQMSVSTSVNLNSISEMTVNTGAVGAEYVSASAGVINYSLKEGRGSLGGRFFVRSSAGKLKYEGPEIYADEALYFTEKSNLIAKGDPASLAKAARYTYTTGAYEIGQSALEADLSLNGALTDDFGFFLSGNLRNNPDCRLPNQKYRELNTQLKLNYNLNPMMKLIGFLQVNDKGKLFGWANTNYQEGMRFFLNGVPVSAGMNWVGSLRLTHFLNDKTFYEVQVSNKNDRNTIGFKDNNSDGKVGINNGVFDYEDMTKGDFITFATTDIVNKYMDDPDGGKFFAASPGNESAWETSFSGIGNLVMRLGRPGIFYEDYTGNTLTAKADFTSQVTFNHQLKGGLMYKLYDIKMDRVASYIGGLDLKRKYVVENWNVKPVEFGLYAQDRMEYAGLVINLGVRVDMFDPMAKNYKNFFSPIKVDSVVTDYGKFRERIPQRGDDIKATWFASPRIAVSHPITDRASMYFSFSKFMQPQAFSILYTNYNDFGNPSLPVVSNLDRKPYYTTNYEIGGTWEFMDKLAMNVNAYYRDIENYSSYGFTITPNASTGGVLYNALFSAGYADVRGIELTLEALPIDVGNFLKVSGRLSYTYSYVKGSAFIYSAVPGNSVQQSTFASASGDSTKFSGQLPFADFNYYKKVEVNMGGGQSSLTGGFDRAHRVGYTLYMRFPEEILLSSTGNFQSGFFYAKTLISDLRAGRELAQGPWNTQIDLRLEKAFSFGNKYRVAVYGEVKNLLGTKNIIAYDNSTTGSTLWETDQNPVGTKNRPIGYDNSMFYDIPREIYFGIVLDF